MIFVTFAERLHELMARDGITNYRLSKLANCSATTVANWLAGKEITKPFLQKLSDIFNVSIDYLLTGEKKETPAETGEREIGFDDFTYAMYHEASELTDSDKELLLGMAKQLREARKKKDEERR